MKIITKKTKNSIIMENHDILEVTSLEKQHIKIILKCLDGTLFIEEKMTKELEYTEEEKAIKTMQEYLKETKMNENKKEIKKST